LYSDTYLSSQKPGVAIKKNRETMMSFFKAASFVAGVIRKE
jgi:hypothetical protein